MPNGDIYIQMTASSESSSKSRTAIVHVPRTSIEKFRQVNNDFHSDDNVVAKSLAEPLARYAFTHRTIFSAYKLACSFSLTPPPEIDGRPPNLSQAGLKVWIVC
jgi:hypothetical protein